LPWRAQRAADAAAIAGTIAAASRNTAASWWPEIERLRETAERSKNSSPRLWRHRRGAERQHAGLRMTELLEGDLYFGRLAILPAARIGLARRPIAAVEDDARRRASQASAWCSASPWPTSEAFRRARYLEISREAHPGFDHPTWNQHAQALALCADPRQESDP